MEDETKLYGECAYLLDKIYDKCESMEGGWDDLINHIASIDDTKFETERDFYFRYYKFLSNIYWRISRWDCAQKFNQVRKKEVYYKNNEGKIVTEPGFTIHNYDYKMYIWALNRSLTYGMNPIMIDVAECELTPAELRRLNKMAEENK